MISRPNPLMARKAAPSGTDSLPANIVTLHRGKPQRFVEQLIPGAELPQETAPEDNLEAAQATTMEVAAPSESSGDRAIDQQLVERVQRGDKRAYELLVAKYQRKIHRLLSRLVRDAAEIEDITQEAFIKAYRALPQFRGESAFYTWLYRIAINTAKNHLVAQGRRVPTTTENNAEEAETFDAAEPLRDISTPESLLMSKQVAQTVNSAMLELPEELRTAITLREMEGLSYDEIAELMNCPIGTVRSRIFRAREAIAERLRPLLGTSKEKRW